MIDVATLLVFLALCDLVLSVAVAAGSGQRPKDGAAHWSASLAVRALAFALFASGAMPRAGTLAVASGLAALSFTLQAGALLAFARRSLPSWVHTTVIAGVAVPLALLSQDAGAAILFGGIVFGTLLVGLAMLAWQIHYGRMGGPRGMLAASFALGALACYVRGVGSLFAADPTLAFLAPTGFQSASLLAAALAAQAGTYAFLLLHKARADAEAVRLATMDALTGTYNRRTFHEIAERELSRARRAGQPLSMIMLDIDHFRAVNEKHGHRVGDALLQRLAEVVRSALRQEDMLVRFGGEEFVVLLPDVPGPGAVVVAGRIRKAVAAQEIELGPLRLAITLSAGVAARLDEGPESVDTLIARAEEALALAKRRGRNRVVALSLGRSIAA
jgi:diguanylate cyclase (GGDEF)-like protein